MIMRNLLCVVLGCWAANAAAASPISVVEENGMTAVLQRTELRLDAPFKTEMVTIMISPGGPAALQFAQDIACGDGSVMGVDHAPGHAGALRVNVLCGAYN